MAASSSSAISAGHKAQINDSACQWYSLLNMRGEGVLTKIARQASQSRDYRPLDDAIREHVKPYLYNNGEGRYIPTSELVHVRRCYREGKPVQPARSSSGIFSVKMRKQSLIRGKTNSVGSLANQSTRATTTKTSTSSTKRSLQNKRKDFTNLSGESMRFVCWDIYKRGTVGETIMHVCLLLGLPLYTLIVKRLLHVFPKLLVDIYVSDQYYGQSMLHLAIVNEDPAMVKYILDRDEWGLHGCKCIGSFFSTFDQSDCRVDVPNSEDIDLRVKTNYNGFVYWGEYPLSFAVCLKQEECVRLLVAKGARCDTQDVNGNTALHMAVIHQQLKMFGLIHSLGGSIDVRNRRDLTPLTLSAELGRVEMYEHILTKERVMKWSYGNSKCAEYPLSDLDSVTIDGQINNKSVLHLVVYGKKKNHLKMVDGMINTLLEEKWKHHIKRKYFKHFLFFLLYYCIYGVALLLRPSRTYLMSANTNDSLFNATSSYANATGDADLFSCYLLFDPQGEYSLTTISRLLLESLTVCGAVTYLVLAVHEARVVGARTFWERLKREPASKGLFLISCLMVVLQLPARILCVPRYEDILAVAAVLLTCPYLLLFCRGWQAIGPFILMIYKMILGDFIKFMTTYVIFLVGFSQALYIAFRRYSGSEPSPFSTPDNAVMGLFYMSMGNFVKLYDSCEMTEHEYAAKLLVMTFMLLVTLILLNMLIAMMANTYHLVNSTDREYLRQWAQVVLSMEHSMSMEERLANQGTYSDPMVDGRRALVVRWKESQTEECDTKRKSRIVKIKRRDIES